MNGALKGWPMNGVYKNIAGMAVCLLPCSLRGAGVMLPDGLIKAGNPCGQIYGCPYPRFGERPCRTGCRG